MKDQAVKEKFVELRAKGWSFDRIATERKVSKQTLINWSRDLALEIRNRRAIEHEALLEQYAMTRKGRIELLGELLKRLKEELAGRSLSAVATERLIDSLLKVTGEFKAVGAEVSFGQQENLSDNLMKGLDKTVAHWSV